MNPSIVGGVMGIGKSIIDRLFPDPKEKAKAELRLLELHQNGDLKHLETRMSAIVMEARSSDKWTSRARPAFLYVMYIMILAAIPMGFWHLWAPEAASLFTSGMKTWLGEIPPGLWGLFSAGYLGYAGARSYDKRNILNNK
jgi:hypothetical protein